MKPLLLILLLSAGVYATWYDYIAPHFQREITLTNKDGVMLEVNLIRRDEINVYFRRQEDPTLYNCEIEKLNFLSRCKVKLYPKSSPNPLSKIAKDNPADNPAQMHLNAMSEELEDIKERRELLTLKRKSADHIYTAQAIDKDIKSLTDKANSLIYKIENLKYRYPHLR